MAIAFQCSCGKAYKVKPELAGKRVKCAACGKIMEVPPVEPQLEDLTSLSADPFAALGPLQSAPLARGPGVGSPLQSALNGPALGNIASGTSGGQSSAGIAPWVWIAAGGGGLVVLIIAAVIVAASMMGGKTSTVASTTSNSPKVASASPTTGTRTTSAVTAPPAPFAGAAKSSPRPPTGWHEGVSSDGKYRAWFPRVPQSIDQTVQTKNGPVKQIFLAVDLGPSGGYLATHSKMPVPLADPEAVNRKVAEMAAQRIVTMGGGKVISSVDRKIGGHNARCFVIEGIGPPPLKDQHLVVVSTANFGYRFYWMGPAGRANRPDIDAFFNSIRLDELPIATGVWVAHRSDGGKYSISLPGKPVMRQDQQATPQGTVTRHSAAVETQHMGGFMVFHNDHPAPVASPQDAIAAVARKASEGIASATSGRVIEERDWPVQGLATKLCILEGSFKGRPARQHILYALSTEKFYQVMWVGPVNDVPQTEIDRFLKSFQLIPN